MCAATESESMRLLSPKAILTYSATFAAVQSCEECSRHQVIGFLCSRKRCSWWRLQSRTSRETAQSLAHRVAEVHLCVGVGAEYNDEAIVVKMNKLFWVLLDETRCVAHKSW